MLHAQLTSGKNFNNFIYEEEHFLDRTFCQCLHFSLVNFDGWKVFDKNNFWDGRTLSFSNSSLIFEHENCQAIVELIRTKIQAIYNAEYVYCDTIDFIKWPVGSSQSPHWDKINGLDHREWGSVIYLNEDYEGGNTIYPELDIQIKPESGKIIIHPGDVDFMHGVSEVIGNDRFTIASFWTSDLSKASYDRIHKFKRK